jgi:predicted glycoside hydrolase/deacetylase ChbG (UPF0249 family)
MSRTLTIGIVFALFATQTVKSARAQGTWAERLGFPHGQRVVIVHASDMGAAYECNAAGQRLLTEGQVQSASVMVPAPWFEEFAEWRRANQNHDVGVTLSLTCPSPIYRWRPISSREQVPSLVSTDGYFWTSVHQVALNANLEEVEQELRAQIALARSSGLRPTHITTHLGTMVTRRDLVELYIRLAREHWLPAVMVEMTPETVRQFKAEGVHLTDEIVQMVKDYPLPKLDHIRTLRDADRYELLKKAFTELVINLPPGLTQIMTTPADDSPALQRITPRAVQRVWHARLLADPDVWTLMKEQQIVLTDWRAIMKRFESHNQQIEE